MSLLVRDCCQIFPSQEMSLNSQIKCLIKLVAIVSVVAYLLGNGKPALEWLMFALFVLVSVYLLQKQKCVEGWKDRVLPSPTTKKIEEKTQMRRMPIQPSFRGRETFLPNSALPAVRYSVPIAGSVLDRSVNAVNIPINSKVPLTAVGVFGEVPYCNDLIDGDNPRVYGMNQSLAGTANPKTNIAPLVPVRSHDLDYWRENNLIIHSAINDERQQDMYLSGYALSTCQGFGTGKSLHPVREGYSEGYRSVNDRGSEGFRAPVPTDAQAFIPRMRVDENYALRKERSIEETTSASVEKERYQREMPRYNAGAVVPVPTDDIGNVPRMRDSHTRENFEMPKYKEASIDADTPNVRPNETGWMNQTCGYNSDNVSYGIPNNLSAGQADRTVALRDYNRNIFTQHVGSDDFSVNHVNEPVNSNIGISFTQQMPPTSVHQDKNGNKFYTQNDPRQYVPPAPSPYVESVRPDNVFDPRSGGYGTSYRTYVDELTGQPRFMYDDIDAVRAPNYIVRSKIDNQPFAESYGTMDEAFDSGNPSTADIRLLAQDKWTRDSIEFREGMMNSMMRKRNSEMWQLREAPLSMQHRG